MAWLEVHDTLMGHPKVYEAAERLGVEPDLLIGKLIRLWLWALSYAMDGNLRRFSVSVLARAANWLGDAEEFLRVLGEVGLVDPDGGIHDWEEYAGRLIDRKEANKERSRKSRETRRLRAAVDVESRTLPAATEDVARTLRATSAHVALLPTNLTNQPTNMTNRCDAPAESDDELKLRLYWTKTKHGKPPTDSDRQAIIQALALPGMSYQRIHGVVDPLVEHKRKQGRDIGGFAYFLPVLSQEVALATMRGDLASHGLEGAPHVLAPASKPNIQDADHYAVLVATGTFQADEWANASAFTGAEDF